MKLNRNGFTLIELIAMLVIIGIFMLLSVPNMAGIVSNQRTNSTKMDAVNFADMGKTIFMRNTKLERPQSGDCAVFTLSYLDDSEDLIKSSNDLDYDRNESLVVVKRSGSEFKYYVRLVERDNNKLNGFDLIDTNNNNFKNKFKTLITKNLSKINLNKNTIRNKTGCNTVKIDEENLKTITETDEETITIPVIDEEEEPEEPPGGGGECSSEPNSFSTDCWSTIVQAVRAGNTSKYNVGDTREIELTGFGKHTIRIANKSKPSSCSNSNFSQTACGFVIEFADVISKYKVLSTESLVGGWRDSIIRTYVNNDIYNSLPTEVKNSVVTTKVISGHECNYNFSTGKCTSTESNYVTNDKMYLFSLTELGCRGQNDSILGGLSFDTAESETRLLDYYSDLNVPYTSCNDKQYDKIQKKYNGSNYTWWSRSPSTNQNPNWLVFYYNHIAVQSDPQFEQGVSPAFKIG